MGFPFRKYILVVIVLRSSCVQMLCINTAMVWMAKHMHAEKYEDSYQARMSLSIKDNNGLNCCLFNINPFPQSYYCKVRMNQQSPEHQLINRLNNACVKFNLCILHHFKFILCMKCNIWYLYCAKSIPKHVHY